MVGEIGIPRCLDELWVELWTKEWRELKLRQKRIGAKAVIGILVPVAATAFGAGTAYAAGSGYSAGGQGTVPAGTPGGFSQVITTQTISPSTTSTTTFSVPVNGATVQVSVPAGTFGNTPVQAVVTAPVLSSVTAALGSYGLGGDQTLGGFGLSIFNPATGQPFAGTFAHPVTITVTNSVFQAGDKVLEFFSNGTVSVDSTAVVVNGSVTVSFSTDPGFAVVGTKSASVVPGATTPVTGKPFLAEGASAVALVGVGAGVMMWSRRRFRGAALVQKR